MGNQNKKIQSVTISPKGTSTLHHVGGVQQLIYLFDGILNGQNVMWLNSTFESEGRSFLLKLGQNQLKFAIYFNLPNQTRGGNTPNIPESIECQLFPEFSTILPSLSEFLYKMESDHFRFELDSRMFHVTIDSWIQRLEVQNSNVKVMKLDYPHGAEKGVIVVRELEIDLTTCISLKVDGYPDPLVFANLTIAWDLARVSGYNSGLKQNHKVFFSATFRERNSNTLYFKIGKLPPHKDAKVPRSETSICRFVNSWCMNGTAALQLEIGILSIKFHDDIESMGYSDILNFQDCRYIIPLPQDVYYYGVYCKWDSYSLTDIAWSESYNIQGHIYINQRKLPVGLDPHDQIVSMSSLKFAGYNFPRNGILLV